MVKVAVLQPLELYRNGLLRLVSDCDDFEVVCELESEIATLERLESTQVDVLLVDVPDGLLSLVRRLRHQLPEVKLLLLFDHDGEVELEMLLQLGVRGFLTRQNPTQVLWRGLRAVASDQSFFCPECSAALAVAVNSGARPSEKLTVREQLILDHTERGMTIKEIARELCLSPRTIESLRGRITRKLRCRNVMQALQKARKQGLLGH